MQPQRLLGVLGDRRQQVLLLAALRDAQVHRPADQLEDLLTGAGVDRDQDLLGGRALGVQSGQRTLDQLARAGGVEDLGCRSEERRVGKESTSRGTWRHWTR